jgi:hypothetical protein
MKIELAPTKSFATRQSLVDLCRAQPCNTPVVGASEKLSVSQFDMVAIRPT